MWFDKIVENITGQQIINDSKTPSGRVHVGSLRGVLIHDALTKALLDKNQDAIFQYGIDDFDPVDGLPHDAEEKIQQYMGHPLFKTPAPSGSKFENMSEHYIAEFLDVFSELGVQAKIYRTSELYSNGFFNEAIEKILAQSDKIRALYWRVGKSQKSANWYPFQVICENCGKLGSTEVTGFDGKEVQYTCHPQMVKWAKGCSHTGSFSPYNGNGKLPWKMEWAAKWYSFNITIEGAGKDHCTKGGSRDMANACAREILGIQPPLNVPYEFFLVDGAKMSSSKGIGSTARDMADFLPPEIIRFLMIRTLPKRTVNFSPEQDYIVKLFNEYDRLIEAKISGKATDEQKRSLHLSQVNPDKTVLYAPSFQLITALVQLPHIDVVKEIAKREQRILSAEQLRILQDRIDTAKYWLAHIATADQRIELQQELPAIADNLSLAQHEFLDILATKLEIDADVEQMQQLIFDVARLTPISPNAAFQAIYMILLGKEQGPKAGALLSFIEHAFIIKRIAQIPYSQTQKLDFYQQTIMDANALEQWQATLKSKIIAIESSDIFEYQNERICEILVTLANNQIIKLRVKNTDIQLLQIA